MLHCLIITLLISSVCLKGWLNPTSEAHRRLRAAIAHRAAACAGDADWLILIVLKPAADSVSLSSSVWLSPEASLFESGSDTTDQHKSVNHRWRKSLYSPFLKGFFLKHGLTERESQRETCCLPSEEHVDTTGSGSPMNRLPVLASDTCSWSDSCNQTQQQHIQDDFLSATATVLVALSTRPHELGLY